MAFTLDNSLFDRTVTVANTQWLRPAAPSATTWTVTNTNPQFYSPVNEEPAVKRNAELIKAARELRDKIKSLQKNSDEFFQTPKTCLIYLDLLTESLFSGKL